MLNTAKPTNIKLHQKSRVVEISFDDGCHFELPCEYLRVFSPSAEVRGHGPGQEVLQVGKETVNVDAIEPVGTYAVVFKFDDGHDTGIYSWDTLYDLGQNKFTYWKEYIQRLADAGYQRKEQPYDMNMIDE